MEYNSANKSESKHEHDEMQNSKTLTNKSSKLSQSGSNLEKFKSLEKKSKNNSKCNSISLKSKHSKNISQDRYKAEEQEADAENDILNEIERSEFSKKSESLKISEKKSSRVQSLKSNEEKNERFVVDKEPEVYEPEAEPMPEPDAEKYGDDFE